MWSTVFGLVRVNWALVTMRAAAIKRCCGTWSWVWWHGLRRRADPTASKKNKRVTAEQMCRALKAVLRDWLAALWGGEVRRAAHEIDYHQQRNEAAQQSRHKRDPSPTS